MEQKAVQKIYVFYSRDLKGTGIFNEQHLQQRAADENRHDD